MEAYMPYLGLAGSAFSTVLTVYLWLVKFRGERPNVRTYLADRELFLGASSAEHRQIGIKLGLIVANYSTLPNALLGVELAVKKRDGTWLAVEGVTFDAQTPMPFNLPALQTVLVRVNGRLRFATTANLEQDKNIAGAYLQQFLDDSRQVRVQLTALNDRAFTATLAISSPT